MISPRSGEVGVRAEESTWRTVYWDWGCRDEAVWNEVNMKCCEILKA